MHKKKQKIQEDDDYFIYTEASRNRKPSDKAWTGPWTPEEDETYIAFLSVHKDIFCSQYKRRSSRIFVQLAKLLKTRSSEQCRVHHEKYEKKFDFDIEKIIDFLS